MMKQCCKLKSLIVIILVVFAWFCTVNACWVWFFLMVEFSWFHFESPNQSINRRNKKRISKTVWLELEYISIHISFTGPTSEVTLIWRQFSVQPTKALGSPPAHWTGWTVHIPSVLLYSQCPRHFTLQQLCTPNSTSAWQIQKSGKTPCSLLWESEQQAFKTAWRSHLESWKEAPWELIASWKPPYTCRSEIRSGDRSLSSNFYFFVKRNALEQSDGNRRVCYT